MDAALEVCHWPCYDRADDVAGATANASVQTVACRVDAGVHVGGQDVGVQAGFDSCQDTLDGDFLGMLQSLLGTLQRLVAFVCGTGMWLPSAFAWTAYDAGVAWHGDWPGATEQSRWAHAAPAGHAFDAGHGAHAPGVWRSPYADGHAGSLIAEDGASHCAAIGQALHCRAQLPA